MKEFYMDLGSSTIKFYEYTSELKLLEEHSIYFKNDFDREKGISSKNLDELCSYFKELKEKLFKAPCAMYAYSDYHNEEKFAGTDYNEVVDNPTGKNTEMYVANCFTGQKILILMLYNCDFNLQESLKVNKKYLSTGPDKDSDLCVKKAVEFFGIDIVIVQNYKDAIKELTKQTQQGKCDYYATWVLSGLPYDIPLPDGGKQYYVDQFIDCLILFWQNGGFVVLFSEGESLTFKMNLF